ncbi:MAG: 50S ribosomal protein L6 [Candidatus Vogelbacteria bacterium]
MSRIGKQLIKIPAGVTVKTVTLDEGVEVTIKGPRGELKRLFRPSIVITIGANEVTLAPRGEAETETALWGTYAAHIKNMVLGVVGGFTKQLVLEGIGYKASLAGLPDGKAGQTLTLTVGFSHPVIIVAPDGVKLVLEKNTLTVSGPSKEAVGQFAASVRAIKPPDPYKEKGIRYTDEKVTRKQGKKVVT